MRYGWRPRPGLAAIRLQAVLAFVLALTDTSIAEAREAIDSAGRRAVLPAKVQRVYAAGPPASIMVFAIAPEKLLGWTRAMTPEEAAFLPERYAALPSLGRLTGRGNTANVEVVLAAKPDLIVDAGATGDTYVSLADRVQQQTGIPYLLYDGTFAQTAATLRALGAAMGDSGRGELLADYVERSVGGVRAKVATIPRERRPRVYYARGPSGLQTALSGSINAEVLDVLGAINVAGSQGAVERPCERLDGAGARLEPGCHHHHRPGILRASLDRCALVGYRRPEERPGIPVTAAAVRLVRFPARSQPGHRAVLARGHPIP